MTKIIERNVAEIIVIGVFLMILLSSCGTLQFGDYNRYQQVYGKTSTCDAYR